MPSGKPARWPLRRRRPAAPSEPVITRAPDPVDGHDILDKVAALPISTWRYQWEPAHVRHLGPMAQDWKAAFGLGEHDTRINTVDANGVALVAIQALHRRITELERRLADTGRPGASDAP
ncbi:tail fiber domain-containing protein [Thermomonospora umbrina]|uniref:Endosialidase-like protein n=1 Tax=Thermomonospora umbrina TaxID=111806 RepID=A0A3D9T843_9ACTN|nr:tail fiber domain-containing protein [Thermomonospora umbrina]REF00845.1 endosialidase-like protein [Thermomonospora umbrina]